MTVAAQADTEIVTGTVIGVEPKSADKWQVLVSTGQQNPRRLWTKDPALVQQMMGLIGQTISFMCGISHWTNNQNQPVKSLWVNGFGAPGQQMQQPQPVQQQPVMQQPIPQQMGMQAQPVPQYVPPAQPQPAPVQQWTQQDTTEQKIHRQTATKVAVHLLKHLEPANQTFDNLLRISERLVSYYDNGVAWPQGNLGDGAGDPGPAAPAHTDDDIPF